MVRVEPLPPCFLHLDWHSRAAHGRPRRQPVSARRRAHRRARGGRAHTQMAPRPRAEAGGGRPRGRGLTALHPLGACEPSSTPPRDLAPCPYRLGGHSPSFGLGFSVSQWTWVVSVESPPTALAGRQSPSLTLMPSNRDRARRGRSARKVRSDLMGPISAKPRVLATRLIRETCGR